MNKNLSIINITTLFMLIFLMLFAGCGGGGGSPESGVINDNTTTTETAGNSYGDSYNDDAYSEEESVIEDDTPNHSYKISTTLSWDAPTTNSDGSTLNDLSGYIVYYGPGSGNYTDFVDVGNTTETLITNLPSGTWCFAITAYDTSGNESDFSGEKCI